MAFFKKNPNEVNYIGGKKHFIDVIKNSGAGDLLLWRQPEEDFNTNSKLIVMPGEMAIFIDGGNIVQTFEEGTYQLSTNNYPFISRLKNALSGGISSFHCVVYFFRKADSSEIKWGTDTPIQVRDRVYQVITTVRARGSYKVRIENPGLFLGKLVGNNIRFQQQEDLNQYFATEMLMDIKSVITTMLNQYNKDLIGISQDLRTVSKELEPAVNEQISQYGLRCVNFSVVAMDVDLSAYQEMNEAQKESLSQITRARGQQASMDILGSNWDKIQAAEIMKSVAENPGAGGIGAMGAGLGMGVAAGSSFGQMAGQIFGGITQNVAADQNQMNAQSMPSQAPAAEDPMEKLTKLKQMLDAGLIEQQEYDDKKKEILSRF